MKSRARFRELLDLAPRDAEAIEFDDRWTTWGTLKDIDAALDRELSALGMGEGTRVGVIIDSRPEHIAIVLSLISRGRCVVTLSPLQPPERLRADISDADLPVVVGSPDALDRGDIRSGVGGAVVLELLEDSVRRSDSGARHAPIEQNPPTGAVVEMLTSGTTGPPKRVLLSEQQLDTAIGGSVPAPPKGSLFRDGVAIVTTPLVHIGGFWGVLGPLYAGRRVAIMPKFMLEPWLRLIARHRPKATGLVPAALRTIISANVPRERVDCLEVITTGTTACPPDLIEEFLRLYGIRVLPTYGATEFAGAVAYWTKSMHEKWWESKAGSVGRPLPGISVRVTDNEGGVLAAGEVGRLEIRGAQSPAGPEAWLQTSDFAAVDDDGFLWIHGRADDAIIRGGFKVQPDTVRKVLEDHPGVREAAVAPLPDVRLGQVPVAGVELADEREVIDRAGLIDELMAKCRAQLLPYEVPIHIAVLSELPRTASSKVSRVELARLIADDMGRSLSV